MRFLPCGSSLSRFLGGSSEVCVSWLGFYVWVFGSVQSLSTFGRSCYWFSVMGVCEVLLLSVLSSELGGSCDST